MVHARACVGMDSSFQVIRGLARRTNGCNPQDDADIIIVLHSTHAVVLAALGTLYHTLSWSGFGGLGETALSGKAYVYLSR